VTPLYPQKLALTSPTGGGRSVGLVRSRNKATEFSFSLVYSGQLLWTQLFWSYFGHSYSGQLIWKQLFQTVILDTYSGQLFWKRLFWTVIFETVILDSYFGHGYSEQLIWTQLFRAVILDTVILDSYYGHGYSRAARKNFRAVVIGLNSGKLKQKSHPIKSTYSPKRMINRSPTHITVSTVNGFTGKRKQQCTVPDGVGASHQQNTQQSNTCT
jgi:hypothetical protein